MKDPNYDLVLKTTCATLLTDKANTVMGLAIRLGNTPRRYLELGFPDLPLAVKVANVEKSGTPLKRPDHYMNIARPLQRQRICTALHTPPGLL